jgi:DNA-binding transcriptional LysR family regulator
MADRRLQVFHTVAKVLSFTKAAEQLQMTQPAVTFQVRQLEEHFATRLFDRTHNRITLTEAGRLVDGYATKILELYSEMERAVGEMTGDVSGHVVVGASTTIAEYLLPSLLSEFSARFPELNISLKVSNTEGVVEMVDRNAIDLGIVEAPVGSGSLEVEVCRMDELVVIVPPNHPLTAARSVSPVTLQDYPFVSREEGSGTREVFHDYLHEHGVHIEHINSTLDLASPEAIKGAVEAGIGISVVSRTILDKELRLGSLAALPLNPVLMRPFSFVRRKQKFRLPVMTELLDSARSFFAHRDPGIVQRKAT